MQEKQKAPGPENEELRLSTVETLGVEAFADSDPQGTAICAMVSTMQPAPRLAESHGMPL